MLCCFVLDGLGNEWKGSDRSFLPSLVCVCACVCVCVCVFVSCSLRYMSWVLIRFDSFRSECFDPRLYMCDLVRGWVWMDVYVCVRAFELIAVALRLVGHG